MSRFADWDDDGEYAALNQGRWEHNARVALKGKRGRQALRDLREALMALPEHKLIDSAVCTVGGPDKRLPVITDLDAADHAAELMRAGISEERAVWLATALQADREDAREHFPIAEGVCAIGAYLWHKRVKSGMDPAEAFDSLPTVDGTDGGDPMHETAELGRDAGLTYTLACELAYRNDEIFRGRTPEERWTAFVAWIDAELGEETAAA